MDRKLCGIIKDVLPLYCDGVTREESNQIIKEHLKICNDCNAYKKELEKDGKYNQMLNQRSYNNFNDDNLRNDSNRNQENSSNLESKKNLVENKNHDNNKEQDNNQNRKNNQPQENYQNQKFVLGLAKKGTKGKVKYKDSLELDEDGIKFKQVAKKLRKRKIINVICTITLICLLYFIKITFYSNMIIDGNSMEPSLTSGKSYVLNKASYWFQSPKRGDIIVAMKDTNVYTKRIIGLPKEKIQMMDGFIYINDKKLEEKYLTLPIEFSGVLDDPVILGDNEYFVLGDNSTVSYDSRHEEFGMIIEENIIGKITRKSIFNSIKFTTNN